MTSTEIRKRFLSFFEKRGHTIVPSFSLVPENDPSVLFNTAGMQPLVPYLLGQKHPAGTRLVNTQKCIRTVDIDEVGDKTHATFFEMLGNWSLGDYFKEEAIGWSYEFLTSKDEGLGLDSRRLYVTVFAGDDNAPRDTEVAEIWKKYIPEHRIYFLGADDNWWSPGDNGPCGPDTEMFYDLTVTGLGDLTHEEFVTANQNQNVVEIWNDVFMQYEKKDGKVVGRLAQQNVDTGSGLERVAAVLQGKDNIFDTDFFAGVMKHIKKTQGVVSNQEKSLRSARIIADHLRAAVFMIVDGVIPSNTDRGYILRRIIRRAVRNAKILDLPSTYIEDIPQIFFTHYESVYPELLKNGATVITVLKDECEKFQKPLDLVWLFKQDLEMARNHKVYKKIKNIPLINGKGFVSGLYVYQNFQTYGVPPDLSQEIIGEVGFKFDQEEFDTEMQKHQDLSRAGAEQKFKGGLGDTSEMSVKYHTATHLLHQALRDVLGNHVEQKGSNITAERLRFDFTHSAKMTDDEKKKVEDIVNDKIGAALPVQLKILPKEEAAKTGALHFFGEKYGAEVNVYFIGNDLESAYSKEFCGGPHIKNTNVLGTFKILKEEAVAQGIRRIKAILI
ncbi:MAG: alanine--tRNA ligase [Patescibacteria group bacterium]